MALQLASESLGEREERDFPGRRENPPSPATERRLLLTAKRFDTVCLIFVRRMQCRLSEVMRASRTAKANVRPGSLSGTFQGLSAELANHRMASQCDSSCNQSEPGGVYSV